MDTDYCAAFRVEPHIEDELPFITIKAGQILMLDNLVKRGAKYLVAISKDELDKEIKLYE